MVPPEQSMTMTGFTSTSMPGRGVSSGDDDNRSDSSSVSGGPAASESDANSGLDGGKAYDERTKEQKKQEAELLAMVQSETYAVFWLRLFLVSCLLASAVVCAILIYLYSSSEEHEAYEEQFESDAQKLFESVGTNFDLTMGAADAFMFQIISQAKSTNTQWPFVSIPDLPQKTAKLISQTDSIYMAFYPLITGEQREEWENFTENNHAWVEESLKVQARNPNFHGPILDDYPLSHIIWNNEGPESYDNQGPFLPSWMGSPVIPYYYPYNWNALAYAAFAKGQITSMESKKVAVTAVANNADPNDELAVQQAKTTSDWAIPYLGPDEDPNEPFADMYYPVVDNIDDVLITITNETKALGCVGFSFYWRHTLKNSLPPNSKGVIVVFRNPCGEQVFTYQIDGKMPTFLGFEDAHDPQYDDMGQTRTLSNLTNMNGIYTGLPMNEDFCPYTLTIYPSAIMKDQFVTTDPVIYSVAVALIFVFTSVVFLCYDIFVSRRQSVIKKRALESGAIVNQLFPETVRDQLYQDAAAQDGQTSGHMGGDTSKATQFRTSTVDKRSPTDTGLHGSPNAHLYEGTSIFFADLVGFTKWSSTRNPEEVFELLESVYGAFDRIAARRKVFKVETIGDCYVAATGIPNPQPMHAVIMVKFAQECLEKVHVVTQELASKLGDDTMELTMRVGVNSGSTTAGVLRGEKGRFQLFGDTVNTAARMESNGVKNRIQVSQATADELIKHGKAAWVIPRKETINAKGKGEMKTYFVTVKRGKNTTASTTSDNLTSMDNKSEELSLSSENNPERSMNSPAPSNLLPKIPDYTTIVEV